MLLAVASSRVALSPKVILEAGRNFFPGTSGEPPGLERHMAGAAFLEHSWRR